MKINSHIYYFFCFLSITFGANAQDALVIEYNCETNCIDLSINGGYAPYEVGWQKWEEEQGYITITDWPKFDLQGDNGEEDLCVTESGDYQVVVLDILCGIVSISENIQISNLGMSDLIQITPSGCSTSEGIIDYWKTGAYGGVDPYTYDWNNGDSGLVIENLSAGTYILTVTDAQGCTLAVEHEVPGIGQPSSFGTVENTCENTANGEIAILFSPEIGPLEFSWDSSLDGQVEISEGTLVEVSNLFAGTYCITATDAGNGCFAKTCMTVDAIQSDEIVIQGASIKPSCNFEPNGSILPFAFGGYGNKYYQWSNGSEESWPKNLLPGTYQVTVSDDCGNSTTAEYEVVGVNFEIDVTADIKCVNINTDIGSIDLTIEGNNPPYSYLWSNGATTKDIQVSQYGAYSVTIKDANGCEYSDTYQVNETFGTMTANITISDLSNCEDQMDISVHASVFGGDAPYNFKWNDGSEENHMKVNMPNSDQESALIYSVTITDQCGNKEIISDHFVCNDICPDDCIEVYKTGNPICTDYCNDHPLYVEDLVCNKIKVKCNCDDGVTRKVLWKNGWFEATFIGKEAQEGSYLEEKVNTFDPLTYTFFIHNEKTGCVSKKKLSRPDDRCGLGIFHWIKENFAGGGPSFDPGSTCTDEEDWHLLNFDYFACEETYQCDEDSNRVRTIKSTEQCKIQDSSTGLWGVYEFCEPTCALISTINSTEEEPNGVKNCPDCLPGFVDPCNDPLDLFTYPGLNGHLSFVKNKNKDHFITEILDSSGFSVRSFNSENLRAYLLKFIRITDKGVLAILLHKGTLEYSLVKIMEYEEYEIIKTFNGEVVENLIVSGVDATYAHIITRDKITKEYKKYYYDFDTRTISILPEHHFSTGKIIWNTTNSYFEVNSNSGFNNIVQDGGGFTQTTTIDSKVLIKTIKQYLGGYLVTGIFTGTLDVNGQVHNSTNQYSTILYWFDSNGIFDSILYFRK